MTTGTRMIRTALVMAPTRSDAGSAAHPSTPGRVYQDPRPNAIIRFGTCERVRARGELHQTAPTKWRSDAPAIRGREWNSGVHITEPPDSACGDFEVGDTGQFPPG